MNALRQPLPREDLEHAYQGVGTNWEALRGQRLLLTGCTGFFGTWLLETLIHAFQQLDLGLEAWFLSRDPEVFLDAKPHLRTPFLHPIQGDIRSFQMPSIAFTHVIHGAASTSAILNTREPEEMLSLQVDGTNYLLGQLRSCPPERLLLISSGAVYGPQPPDVPRLCEDYWGGPDPMEPLSAYAEGKRMAEHLCAIWARQYGTSFVSARAFAFVGPGLPLDAHFAVGNFLADALAGRTIQVHGDGTPLRSYMHTADLAVWLWRLLLEGKAGEAYNLGADETVSIAELAQEVASLRGVPMIILERPRKFAPPQRYIPDIRKARSLGLEVLIPRMEALRRTFEWLMLNRPKQERIIS